MSGQSIPRASTYRITLHANVDVLPFICRSDDDLKQRFPYCLEIACLKSAKMLVIFRLHRCDEITWDRMQLIGRRQGNRIGLMAVRHWFN
jgi:hypothetical protein